MQREKYDCPKLDILMYQTDNIIMTSVIVPEEDELPFIPNPQN